MTSQQDIQAKIDMLEAEIIPIPEGLDERIVRIIRERNEFHQGEILFFKNRLDELSGSNDISIK